MKKRKLKAVGEVGELMKIVEGLADVVTKLEEELANDTSDFDAKVDRLKHAKVKLAREEIRLNMLVKKRYGNRLKE